MVKRIEDFEIPFRRYSVFYFNIFRHTFFVYSNHTPLFPSLPLWKHRSAELWMAFYWNIFQNETSFALPPKPSENITTTSCGSRENECYEEHLAAINPIHLVHIKPHKLCSLSTRAGPFLPARSSAAGLVQLRSPHGAGALCMRAGLQHALLPRCWGLPWIIHENIIQ